MIKKTGKSFFGIYATIAIIICTMNVFSFESGSKLITTGWLRAHIQKEDIRIIDTRSSLRDFKKSHIPGAVHLSIETIQSSTKNSVHLEPQHLVNALSKLGISEKNIIIVYADSTDWRPFYLLWALDYLGHPNAALLEGGIDKWRNEERPLTIDTFKPKQLKYTAHLIKTARAETDDLKHALNTKTAVVLSTEKDFTVIPERIKGAIARSWSEDINDDGMWKNTEEIRKAYRLLGITSDKPIIVTSSDGQSSCITYFTLRYMLGFSKVKNYDCGYSQIANELPIISDERELEQTSSSY